MHLADELEKLRAILFTGKSRPAAPPLTHPEYIAQFENRMERDPEAEWKALRRYAQAIIPLYRVQLKNMHRMASYVRGEEAELPPMDEETIIKKLYEGIMELETEEDWQEWVRHWSGQVNAPRSD